MLYASTQSRYQNKLCGAKSFWFLSVISATHALGFWLIVESWSATGAKLIFPKTLMWFSSAYFQWQSTKDWYAYCISTKELIDALVSISWILPQTAASLYPFLGCLQFSKRICPKYGKNRCRALQRFRNQDLARQAKALLIWVSNYYPFKIQILISIGKYFHFVSEIISKIN